MDHLLSKDTLDRFAGPPFTSEMKVKGMPQDRVGTAHPGPCALRRLPMRVQSIFKTIHATDLTARGGPVCFRKEVNRVCSFGFELAITEFEKPFWLRGVAVFLTTPPPDQGSGAKGRD